MSPFPITASSPSKSAPDDGCVSDERLVILAHAGRVDCLNALLERYRRFARAKARGYFLAGGDIDDIEQEGMIGLYKAVRDFRADRESSFRAFAELCVTRQIITAIKTAARQKHRPLNQYVSLSGVRAVGDSSERSVEDFLYEQVPDPVEEIIASEWLAGINDALARVLSGLEVDVLWLYVEGRTYQEIGEELGRHVKAVDNALQRIKRKLEAHLGDPRDHPDVAVA